MRVNVNGAPPCLEVLEVEAEELVVEPAPGPQQVKVGLVKEPCRTQPNGLYVI